MPEPTTTTQWIDHPPPAGAFYWTRVRRKAFALKSDGCTLVSEAFHEACLEHDIHWRTGKTIYGRTISTAQANRRLRKVIQSRSIVGAFSPLSWIRWAGVTVGGTFLNHASQ